MAKCAHCGKTTTFGHNRSFSMRATRSRSAASSSSNIVTRSSAPVGGCAGNGISSEKVSPSRWWYRDSFSPGRRTIISTSGWDRIPWASGVEAGNSSAVLPQKLHALLEFPEVGSEQLTQREGIFERRHPHHPRHQPVERLHRGRAADERQVVLAEVHPVGAHRQGQVEVVVDHQQRAGRRRALAVGHGEVVQRPLRQLLLAELDDPRPALEGGVERVILGDSRGDSPVRAALDGRGTEIA